MSIEDNFFENYCDDLQRQQENDREIQYVLNRLKRNKVARILEKIFGIHSIYYICNDNLCVVIDISRKEELIKEISSLDWVIYDIQKWRNLYKCYIKQCQNTGG